MVHIKQRPIYVFLEVKFLTESAIRKESKSTWKARRSPALMGLKHARTPSSTSHDVRVGVMVSVYEKQWRFIQDEFL